MLSNTTDANAAPKNQADPFDFITTLTAATLGLANILTTNIPLTFGQLENIVTKYTEVFNSMETQVTSMANLFGGTREFAQSIRDSMALASVSVKELGGDLKDISAIQTGVIKGLNTQTILNSEAYAGLFAVSKLTADGVKDLGASTTEMVTKFSNAGYGLYDIEKQMTGIIKEAREMGVTTVAVYNQINANMEKLNLYNFANGVQGMAEMAAKAAGLRIDMGTTLKLADDLFNPEKAIDMAASFQRLGVQVSSLLDPYKLMDMARNDPQALQDSLIEATKALTYFDEKNQKISILPGAQGQLRELSTALNIPLNDLTKMAINAGELDKKLSEISFPTEFSSDEDKTMLANLSQLKDGKYMIQFDDKDGKSMFKEVSQLTKDDRDQLRKQAEAQGMTAIDLQKEANGYLKTLANAVIARQYMTPTLAAANSSVNQGLVTTAKELLTVLENPVSDKILGINRTSTGTPIPLGQKENVDNVITFLKDNVASIFGGDKTFKEAADEALENIKSKGITALNDISKLPKAIQEEMERKHAQDPNFKVLPIDKITEKFTNGIQSFLKNNNLLNQSNTQNVQNQSIPTPQNVVPASNINANTSFQSNTQNVQNQSIPTPQNVVPASNINANTSLPRYLQYITNQQNPQNNNNIQSQSMPFNFNFTFNGNPANKTMIENIAKEVAEKAKKEFEDKLKLKGIIAP
jgi:hypothetical protein